MSNAELLPDHPGGDPWGHCSSRHGVWAGCCSRVVGEPRGSCDSSIFTDTIHGHWTSTHTLSSTHPSAAVPTRAWVAAEEELSTGPQAQRHDTSRHCTWSLCTWSLYTLSLCTWSLCTSSTSPSNSGGNLHVLRDRAWRVYNHNGRCTHHRRDHCDCACPL